MMEHSMVNLKSSSHKIIVQLTLNLAAAVFMLHSKKNKLKENIWKKKWALSCSADSISAASPVYQAHVPMELPSPSEKTTNPYKVYNQQIPSSPTRMLENDRILIYLRSRPHKEQPPGLELGTQDWQSKNRTARPHRRPR